MVIKALQICSFNDPLNLRTNLWFHNSAFKPIDKKKGKPNIQPTKDDIADPMNTKRTVCENCSRINP